MERINEADFLATVLPSSPHAVAFCQSLFGISQTLDDLIDKDNPVTDDAIVHAFWSALIELPGNPFYREHEPYLRPLMASALQDWRDSVVLERNGDRHGQTLAFVLRSQLTSVVVQCAYLVGGTAWMNQVSEPIRRYFHNHTLEDYVSELKEEADVRRGQE